MAIDLSKALDVDPFLRDDQGEIVRREADSRAYPSSIDKDFYDEVFPPTQDDILSHALREASDIHTVMELARHVLRLAQERKQKIAQLSSSVETIEMCFRQREEHLIKIAKNLAAVNADLRRILKENGIID